MKESDTRIKSPTEEEIEAEKKDAAREYTRAIVEKMIEIELDEFGRELAGKENENTVHRALLITAAHLVHLWNKWEDVGEDFGEHAVDFIDTVQDKSIAGLLSFLCDIRYNVFSTGPYISRDAILKHLKSKGVEGDVSAVRCERELLELYNASLPQGRRDLDWIIGGKPAIKLDASGAIQTRTIGDPTKRRT